MKKVILSIGTTLMIASAIFVSCKKENLSTAQSAKSASSAKVMSASGSAFKVNVNAHGFLVFATSSDVDKYVAFLQSNSLADVKAYHNSIGFVSLAGLKYDGIDPQTMVTDEQVKDFMLDANGLIEIQGTIFKPTGDNTYLLTLQESILNDANFRSIVAESFDVRQMDRFAITNARANDFDLFAVIGRNPTGIGENSTGGEKPSIMRFWGTSQTSTGPCQDGFRPITRTRFMFWIPVSQHGDWIPC